jgi:hypothetical protein
MPRPPTFVVCRLEFGYDPTPKNADARARIAAAVLPKLAAQSSGFSLWALDHKTTLISTIPPHDQDDAYALIKEGIIKKMVPVTDLSTFMEKMANRSAHAQGKVIIMADTDGLDDGKPLETARRITAASKRLAANPDVLGVVLVGIERDIRPGWIDITQMLDPLHEKLHMIPLSQASKDQILHEIQSIRGVPPRR